MSKRPATSDSHYRLMFTRTRAIMLLVDPEDGAIIDASQGACEFYGYSCPDITTLTMFDINTMDRATVSGAIRQATSEKKNSFHYRHRLASGEERDVEIITYPIPIEGREYLYSVIQDITERVQMEKELKYLATHDSLTGLSNREAFQKRLTEEMGRAKRYDHPLSLFLLDLDRFKQINDTEGHRVGDAVLSDFARMLEGSIRQSDYAARYGGEEFAIILPETPLAKARDLAERLCRLIAAQPIELEGYKVIRLTVSIGVAAVDSDTQSWDDLLHAADLAMYAAKKKRNCIRTTEDLL